jgi:hypothetical protein
MVVSTDLPAFDCADGRASAKMAAHDAQLRGRFCQHGGYAFAHEAVGSAVEAVAADAELLAPLRGHAITGGVLGHGGVELGFESRHQRHSGHGLSKGTHSVQIDEIMGRGSGQEFFHGGQQGGIHPKGSAVAASGVHGFERDRIDGRVGHADLRDGVAIIGDAFHAAAREYALRGHIQNLVLERSGA